MCVTAVSRSRCFRARATLYRQRRYDSGHETFSLPILPCYFPRFHGVIAGLLPIHTNETGEGEKFTPPTDSIGWGRRVVHSFSCMAVEITVLSSTLYRQRRNGSGHDSLPILPCYFPRFHGVIAGVLPIHTNEKGEGNKCTPCRLKRVGEESRALILMHGRSLMTIDPRIPTMPGRSTSGFHDFTDQAGRLGD